MNYTGIGRDKLIDMVEELKGKLNKMNKFEWSGSDSMSQGLRDIVKERYRQEKLKEEGKFLFTCADTIPDINKLTILTEELGEVAHEVCDMMIVEDKANRDKCAIDHIRQNYRGRLRKELIQVIAVSLAWVESLDDAKNTL